MNEIAGMVIENGTATLVVLARDGDALRVTARWAGALVAAVNGLCPPACPVILDAAAWPGLRHHGIHWPETLRGNGWDIRPPMWRDGRPANPTWETWSLKHATDMVPDDSGQIRNGAHLTALWLATWGATQPDTARRAPTAAPPST